MKVILFILLLSRYCIQSVFQNITPISKSNSVDKKHEKFLQLSYDQDGQGSDLEDDDSKIIIIFVLNVIACALSCAFIQGVLIMSKKLNGELLLMRKNYTKYQTLLKFKEFKTVYKQGEEEGKTNS